MMNIRFEDLAISSFCPPADHVRMVVAQPHLPRESFTPREPYCLQNDAKERQIEAITTTLDIVSGDVQVGRRTHFTVLPEYSIPGITGVNLVQERVASDCWPCGSVLIGGTDGLTKPEYVKLLQDGNTHIDGSNKPDNMRDDQWTNCAIIWIKFANGDVCRWVQPKLHPAWEEQDVICEQMFKGRSVFLFRGRRDDDSPFLFCTLICFDWVGTISSSTPYQRILQHVHDTADVYSRAPMTWVFVIQRNPKPSHPSFLNGVSGFFAQTAYPKADRSDACIIFANSAGKGRPGPCAEFGSSALVLSPRARFGQMRCPPTYSTASAKFRRGSEVLSATSCHDLVFREGGACVHVFEQVNPRSIDPGVGSRNTPIREDAIFPIVGTREPRAPGRSVAAPTKWVHDGLDGPSGALAGYNGQLAASIEASQERAVASLRTLLAQGCATVIRLGRPDGTDNADEWAAAEIAALRHVVQTLAIVAIEGGLTEVGLSNAHAIVEHSGEELEVLAVFGSSHEACRRHADAEQPLVRRRAVLLVSRDAENTSWSDAFGSILEHGADGLGAGGRFTEPPTVAFQIGYQDLFSIYQKASTTQEVTDGIHHRLGG